MSNHLRGLPRPLFALILAVLALSTAQAAAPIPSTFSLPSFSKIEISSSLTARIEVGGPQAVRVEGATAGELQRLHLEVVDGTLKASTDRDSVNLFVGDKPRYTITITVPDLTDLSADAESTVSASKLQGDIVHLSVGSGSNLVATGVRAGSSRLDVSSGGTLVIDGTCDNANARVSSGATISGNGLSCLDLDVAGSSGGVARLRATREVVAAASSGSRIEISGQPARVETEMSSGGAIKVLH